jgi:hypothetical protein
MECKIEPFMQEKRLIYNTSNLFKFENQGRTPTPTHMRRGLLTCKNPVQRWMLQWLSKHMTNRKISSLNISPKTTSQAKQHAGTFTSVCFSLGTWVESCVHSEIISDLEHHPKYLQDLWVELPLPLSASAAAGTRSRRKALRREQSRPGAFSSRHKLPSDSTRWEAPLGGGTPPERRGSHGSKQWRFTLNLLVSRYVH